jgi:hypothetical protein
MIWKILFWAAIIYILCIVLWRLFMAIMMILEGYSEGRWRGALVAALINFLFNLWDFAKFAFVVLIFVLIFRGCDKETPSAPPPPQPQATSSQQAVGPGDPTAQEIG